MSCRSYADEGTCQSHSECAFCTDNNGQTCCNARDDGFDESACSCNLLMTPGEIIAMIVGILALIMLMWGARWYYLKKRQRQLGGQTAELISERGGNEEDNNDHNNNNNNNGDDDHDNKKGAAAAAAADTDYGTVEK